MFEKDSCFKLGYISGLHGYKGEVKFFLDTDEPHEFDELESVFVEYDNKLIPFFLEHIHVQNSGYAIVKFEDIDSEEQAKKLIGLSLYLPLEILPELDDSEFYFHEAVGFDVYDNERGFIGKFIRVLELPNNPVMQIDLNGIEILVPKRDEFITSIDRINKKLQLNVPSNLLDIYLGEEEE